LVPDERDEVAAVGVASRFGVHLVHERARRVDDAQPAPKRVLLHGGRDAVRREHAVLALGDLGLVLDEDGAELLEAPHDVLVVDDLVPDVDGSTVLLEQSLDDLDRAVDAGAKGPRRGEEDAPVHAIASSRRSSACRASLIERIAAPRRVATQRRSPRTSVFPFACTVESTPSIELAVSSETARTTPARRPLRARTPLSMSTASAPVASCRRRRSAASCTRASPPRIV